MPSNDDADDVLPPLRTLAAVVLATCIAAIAASARADNPPAATFHSHGVRFSYPADWMKLPVTYKIKVGTQLWVETIGPAPTPSASRTPDVVTISGSHIAVAVTKKNIGLYKGYFAMTIRRVAVSAHGRVESGPTRINVGNLPGYVFRLTAQGADGTVLENRMAFVFNGKTEYFVNCVYRQNDPHASEIESGCTQIMQSFKLAK